MDENPENSEPLDVSTTRRGFIKKAAYTAPTLLVLGSLAKTRDAQAAFGLPPSLCAPTNCLNPPSPFKSSRQRQRR